MSKKIYYKSEVMEAVNKAVTDEIGNVLFDRDDGSDMKVAMIEGMLTLKMALDDDLPEENEN